MMSSLEKKLLLVLSTLALALVSSLYIQGARRGGRGGGRRAGGVPQGVLQHDQAEDLLPAQENFLRKQKCGSTCVLNDLKKTNLQKWVNYNKTS